MEKNPRLHASSVPVGKLVKITSKAWNWHANLLSEFVIHEGKFPGFEIRNKYFQTNIGMVLECKQGIPFENECVYKILLVKDIHHFSTKENNIEKI